MQDIIDSQMSVENYFLSTARLGFRWWTPEDFPIALALWGDTEVSRLLSKEPWTEVDVSRMLDNDIERKSLWSAVLAYF